MSVCVFVSELGCMSQILSMQCTHMRVCAESFRAALYSPLWSPQKVFLLSPEEQRSNENHLVINWSLEGPMNG